MSQMSVQIYCEETVVYRGAPFVVMPGLAVRERQIRQRGGLASLEIFKILKRGLNPPDPPSTTRLGPNIELLELGLMLSSL